MVTGSRHHSERGFHGDKRSLWDTRHQESTLLHPFLTGLRRLQAPTLIALLKAKLSAPSSRRNCPGQDSNPRGSWSLVFLLLGKANREAILRLLGSYSALLRKPPPPSSFAPCLSRHPSPGSSIPHSPMHVCRHTHVCTCAHTHTSPTRTCRHMHTHAHVHIYIPPMCACRHMHVYTRTHNKHITHACVHTYVHVCTYTRHPRVYADTRVHTHTHT